MDIDRQTALSSEGIDARQQLDQLNALVQPWGRMLPRRLVRVSVWTIGGFLLLYGGANLIDHGLMVADVIHTPAVLGRTAVQWHLVLWDPWWVLGGLLMIATARSIQIGGVRPGT